MNVLPETPGPEKVPPDGVPSVSVRFASYTHTKANGNADNVTVGKLFTVIICDADAVHPAAFVAVTVYAVFTIGFTVIPAVVAPVFQLYDTPSFPVMVVDSPSQIVVVPVIDGEGNEFTVTNWLVLAVQPNVLVAVTV